jgi:hypothetical protein
MIYQGYQLYKHNHRAKLNIRATSALPQTTHKGDVTRRPEVEDEAVSDDM